MHVARSRESNKEKVKKGNGFTDGMAFTHKGSDGTSGLRSYKMMNCWKLLSGKGCLWRLNGFQIQLMSWWYTVKAHLGSYLTSWRQIRVPLVIFHPPTARGIEIPHGNSSVCLSNCTVQTACPNFATSLLDSNSLGKASSWLTRTGTFTIFWIS